MEVRRLLALGGLAIGTGGLVLQAGLTIPAFLAAGRWLPDALITFFTFYTILTNLALVLIYLSEVSQARWLRHFRPPLVRAMMVAVMILVCGFYHQLLAGLWAPQGLFRVADVTLHYVTPAYYALWWVLAQRHGGLGYADIPLMLVPTLVYFLWVMARGAIVTEYPYPILAADSLGYGQVMLNALFVALFLGVVCLLVVLADKLLARGRGARADG